MRITPLALAAGLMAGGAPACRAADDAAPAAPGPAAAPIGVEALQQSPVLRALPRGAAGRQLPALIEADAITSRPDLETVAEGSVVFRRGGSVLRADRVSYDSARDLAAANGHVRISRAGQVYSGPELLLQVQRFEGHFLQPTFEFTQLGAGGRADRIDFLDSAHSRATNAEYTSCPRDQPGEPDWVLKMDRLDVDLDTDTGVAHGAVLHFLHVPILALPALSFPLGDARKSGWLPPSITTDNRSGVEVAVPYYWNIAPNRDATLTPRAITRRGFGLDSEFRYLEPRHEGSAAVQWLPDDRVAGRSRESLRWLHEGRLFSSDLHVSADVVRVSDSDWWKDFPDAGRSLTPRLLPLKLAAEQPFALGGKGNGLAYARVVQWQVLQGSDVAVVGPYERSPQVGVRLDGQAPGGVVYGVETEYNHFTLPAGALARNGRSEGERWHLLGSASLPWRKPGWWVVPKASVNAATYGDTGLLPSAGQRASRVIPTFSIDAGFEFERNTRIFGRNFQQTLEPRLLYVRTPYRAQSQLPNYDSAAKDFNFTSIYTDNQFSGVDRVNDANQLTAGVTTRFVDAASGAEALRLGLVQRYLFRTQRVTANADGTPDGPALEQKFSDALLLGSTTLLPHWTLDAAVQYSPDIRRSVRSILGARYEPGPYRTISATYRLARGSSEQLELGWQWPLIGAVRDGSGNRPASASGGSCSGTWYAVGRVNYSLKDSRVTDSVLGTEYDAGCWIGRIVAERLSTGRSEATTRFMLQLELIGLSRLGSNPLRVLKDNIPGYRLLRDERRSGTSADDRSTAVFND